VPQTGRPIDAAGKCDRCLGHKAMIYITDYPVGVTATTLSYIYCRWDDTCSYFSRCSDVCY